jgi:hypothetical protein
VSSAAVIDRIAAGRSFETSREELGESVASMHSRYGCYVCGDRSGRCGPTLCVGAGLRPLAVESDAMRR